jgi:hypothetical protein
MEYLFKCIYKEHDRACITVGTTTVDDNNEGVDEIKRYRVMANNSALYKIGISFVEC